MNKFLRINILLIGSLLCTCFLMAACGSRSIVVPNSDTTPPSVVMSVDFTTRDDIRMTIDLNSNSTPASFELSPMEPIAILASATDNNGGALWALWWQAPMMRLVKAMN